MAPIKSVLSRMPWGGGIAGIQKDISAVQTSLDPKNLTPEAQAIARTYKNNAPLVDKLNTVLDDKQLVNEVLQAHRTAHNAEKGATQIAGPLEGLSPWQRLATRVGGWVTGSGVTQSQRDAHQLPDALAHLATPGRNQDLHTRLSERLGLTPDTAAKGFEDSSRMLRSRQVQPGQYQLLSEKYPLPSKGTLGRAALGAVAPDLIKGLFSAWHGVRGE